MSHIDNVYVKNTASCVCARGPSFYVNQLRGAVPYCRIWCQTCQLFGPEIAPSSRWGATSYDCPQQRHVAGHVHKTDQPEVTPTLMTKLRNTQKFMTYQIEIKTKPMKQSRVGKKGTGNKTLTEGSVLRRYARVTPYSTTSKTYNKYINKF